jgi:hypothetical protein
MFRGKLVSVSVFEGIRGSTDQTEERVSSNANYLKIYSWRTTKINKEWESTQELWDKHLGSWGLRGRRESQ